MSQKKRYDSTRQWYAIHTYSGYEEKVAESIGQRVESVDMADKIFDVLVPKEKMIEIKNGKRKVVEKKIFQGYVLVDMKMTEDAWYIVRNTPGVTGFVGTGTDPSPMSEDEIKKIKKRMGVEDPKHHIDFSVGEIVNITDGPFKGFDGAINEIDETKGKIKVLVSMFGRETPVELDALQVKKV
ncbi:transcription termination/antitermination protein NusG [Candidatus Saccharibacteria bacterium]|nr:transcription termination/antitermination protein NusG [Candidatus Saccharibacteria bacterium]NCU40819.1 transcription termination/antitermination protein NusG [Candidatus Saccharibacteria bacterium]